MNPPVSVNLMPTIKIETIVQLAQLSEKLGYRRCWVYDEGLHTRDVFVTLTAIAIATEKILLGPGITNPYVRHPGITAAAIASLDEISAGRAFIGLGAGGGLTLNPLGIERSKPIKTVSDTVTALRELFEGKRVDIEGEEFSLKSAYLDYGRETIEIFLAGRGKRITQIGAELGDGFYLSYIHKDFLSEHIDALRNSAKRDPFRIVYSTMIVSSEKEFEDARAALSFRLVDSPQEVKDHIGMTEDLNDQLKNALTEGGPSHAASYVPREWVEQFVITGSQSEASTELGNLISKNGIDEFQLPIGKPEEAERIIQRTSKML
ncbi:MAG: LLM class flavin-dependent oxidoreductase [Actinomycetota bacterium]|nr:LLM class flavin-dependent oxidoreductase [Actinomycetota bacterium]